MRRIFLAVLTVTLVGLSGAFASGHGRGGDRGPEFVDELAPLDVCGTFVGGHEGTGLQVNTATYEYRWPSTLTGTPAGLAPGQAVDFHWVQDLDVSADPAVASPLVWDFGEDPVRKVRMYPSVDHEPIPGEGIEATVYSSASVTGPWVPAHLRKVYVPGWNPGWIADDYVSLWRLRASARYVAVKWGGPGALLADGDAEIDAVCRADDGKHTDRGHGHEWGSKPKSR